MKTESKTDLPQPRSTRRINRLGISAWAGEDRFLDHLFEAAERTQRRAGVNRTEPTGVAGSR
ncbi:hypothetical protein A1D31_37160 [Bradyrhizobium liaoningense]|nr:hypothetical protein A1D31_37160 [Bradyrhizobium liaoningense]